MDKKEHDYAPSLISFYNYFVSVDSYEIFFIKLLKIGASLKAPADKSW